MNKISGKAAQCRQREETCRLMAADVSFDSTSRRQFLTLAEHWRELARSYELAEEVSGYIQWQSRRVAPPPDWDMEEVSHPGDH